LQAQLQRHLPWHRARLNFLAKGLLALLAAGSVNLTKVARAFSGPAQLDSHCHLQLNRSAASGLSPPAAHLLTRALIMQHEPRVETATSYDGCYGAG
jgi:hypothetical protein